MPHVHAWWREKPDLEAKYGPAIDGTEPIYVFLIERDKQPIGFIQWYRWADFAEHAAQLGAAPDSAGIDLAIGAPEMVGRGLGALAIRAFLDEIVFVQPGITACVADPETQNTRSLRAFEKAGFTKTRNVRLPGEAYERTVVLSKLGT
jgi:RimJ/RimL family protein N-acetyltransferase